MMTAIHNLANLLPEMTGEEYQALKSDIEANGLLEKIWLYEGQILDGRHRHRACVDLGIDPEFLEYEGSDPIGFVVSLNLKRRHLTNSQRAMVGEYKRAIEKGEHPRHAAYLAREVSTDFAMRGDDKAMGFLYDTVLFLRPAVVSMDRLYRGLAHDPNRHAIAMKTGALVLSRAPMDPF